MSGRAANVVRWVAMVPGALLGVLAVQVIVFQTTALALDPGRSWAHWAAKAVSSLFMGAALVAIVWWVAPRAKAAAATLAFVVVVLWGGLLAASAFEGGFFIWLFAMGAAGVLGGAAALWMVRRALPRLLRA